MRAMKSEQPLTRRSFIQKAATVTALGFAAPSLMAASRQRAKRPAPGPSSRIHLGIIGCGGMGRANLEACASQPDVVVTAACDVWGSRRESVAEQFKGACKV